MSFRRVLNIIYALHVKEMDGEQRAQFDATLNDGPGTRQEIPAGAIEIRGSAQ
jgi:hypothetical protein